MIARFIDTLGPALGKASVLEGPPARSRDDVRFMELEDAYIRYRVAGGGDHTIALAPDPPLPLEQYDSIFKRLSKQYRVVLFEIPAMGFSVPKLGFDFTYEAWTETTARFLQRLGYGPYVLALPCIAGYSAIGIARRYPALVQGLVTSQMPAWDQEVRWVQSRNKLGILGVPVYGQLMLHLLKRKRASRVYREICRKNVDALVENTDWAMANGACFTFASAAQNYMTPRPPDGLQPLDLPSLSIWGAADPSHEAVGTDKESIRALLPGVEMVYLPEAGHYVEAEEPEAYCEIVTDFIGRQQGRAWAPLAGDADATA